MFKRLYNWTMHLAAHRLAIWWLGGIGVIESIFFPIPADALLVPMCLAKPQRAYFYAGLLSVCSVLGGVVGYLLGLFFADSMQHFLTEILHQQSAYTRFQAWFERYGFVAVFIAGFTPLPYKVVTICAGILRISFPVFFLASAISRPLRFFLLAFAIRQGGVALEEKIAHYIEYLGWFCVFLVLVAIAYLYFT